MVNVYVPGDFLACGEVEKDGSVHDVDLAGLCRRDTAHGVFNVFKLDQRLSHAWHHGQVTAKNKSHRFYHHDQLFFPELAIVPDFSKLGERSDHLLVSTSIWNGPCVHNA